MSWIETVARVAAVPMLCVNAVALFLNAYQARRNVLQSRAAAVSDSFKLFMTNADIQDAFYTLEYDRFRYEAGFHGSPDERKIDRLLRLFSNVALLVKAGLVRERDVRPFRYYILRIHANEGIQEYLKFMQNWVHEASLQPHPCEAFEWLAQRMKALHGRPEQA